MRVTRFHDCHFCTLATVYRLACFQCQQSGLLELKSLISPQQMSLHILYRVFFLDCLPVFLFFVFFFLSKTHLIKHENTLASSTGYCFADIGMLNWSCVCFGGKGSFIF